MTDQQNLTAPDDSGVRCLRMDQYDSASIAPGTPVRLAAEIVAAIGAELRATGTHSDPLAGLYAFIRQGRGAGFQGTTRDPLRRPLIVARNFAAATGEVLAAIDFSLLDPGRVSDFQDPGLQTAFLARYTRFSRQVAQLASEGVVAVRGGIPATAVRGLVRVAKPADEATTTTAFVSLLEAGP